jgi:hypothetical protein
MGCGTLSAVLRAPCARRSIRFCRKDSVMRDLLTSSSASAAAGLQPLPSCYRGHYAIFRLTNPLFDDLADLFNRHRFRFAEQIVFCRSNCINCR